ncbi:MAG: hypothetical protein COV45_03515 [Deltaproteobacteria bacterium CG11_big_fil_rev_8_21_14_0_20_47_16]|nr:MAG: hypothetical protein COV45_03515 [Deltaproteobacteria bacterium CG11_big_fil_rev_8_21_14_0_20_47_16]
MKPQQKIPYKQLFAVAWVIFISACGSMNDNSPSNSLSATNTAATDPVSVSNTVNSVKELGVGDVYQVAFAGSQPMTLDMSDVPEGAEYILAVSNLNTSGSSSNMQLASSESEVLAKSVSANVDEEVADHENEIALSDVAARFHEELRFQEEITASEDHDDSVVSASKSVAAASASSAVPQVGDQARFNVLSSLGNTGTTTVTATAKCIGQNVIFYVDNEVASKTASDLPDSDVQLLCDTFDRRVPQERAIFGSESDVDGNGHLNVLMTPQINKMGAALGGLITGFFYAANLYDPGMEIIYTLVPDGSAVYGQTVPRDFAMENLLPSVLIHEFQHAISYNQHVLIHGGSPEEPVFNEGLSHLSEDLFGEGRENYARYETFLAHPANYGLFSGGSPNLGTRGASYLFLRYLMEQSGSTSFVTRLLNTDQKGAGNIESAFDSKDASFDQFGEFYLRWVATLALGSQGLSKDPRFSYQDRTRNSETNNWEGVTLLGDADDGRGTQITGIVPATYRGYTSSNVMPGGSQFYRVTSAPSEISLYSRGTGNFGAVVVRVK